jgi:hypothetical protein
MPNPLLIPAGFAEAIFSINSPGPKSPISFSCGVELGGATEFNVATDLAAWLSSSSAGGYREFLSNKYSVNQVEVVGHTLRAFNSASGAGLLTDGPSTPQSSLKVQKFTTLRGKANKGYMFPPGLLTDSNVDEHGVIDPAIVSDLVGTFAGLLTAIQSSATGPCILHHANSSVTTPTTVTAFHILPVAHTQRRRMNH